ncbi:TetR/AcrR family transcriptional regulator [Nocardia panacis]|uniref:TetR/AcrR family transcriptional regulator n=1 Tax=Nocardia panacis TaxID=2340916 RepID=UPI00193A86B3|nr:TetR/AcrR family transcriptional regulator [Nocardia panacis]
MASRRDWLDAGLEILCDLGAPGLTIDQLTGRLGLSKGSFYHHFQGIGEFKTALLAHFEAERTTRYIDLVAAEPDLPAAAKLRRTLEVILTDGNSPDVEVAVRAWALQDPQARAVQERVDRTRIDYVGALCREMTGSAAESEEIARMLYVVIVGSRQIVPPVDIPELRRMCELTLGLATTGSIR